MIVLSEKLYKEVMAHPIPTDLEAMKEDFYGSSEAFARAVIDVDH